MSAYQPPLGEARPHPHSVSSILFPEPWQVASFSGKAPDELTRTVFSLAFAAWRESMGVVDA